MVSDITFLISALGVGGVLGAIVKYFFDKRQLRFSKVFKYKEARYKAIMILMWVAMNPDDYEFKQLGTHRPEIKGKTELNRELELEYHNVILFASDEVLDSLLMFL